ncbi:PE-PGRS family protein PE_PGRS33-like isoform X1 [Aphis gossypii]|uniref:PE-PGRS family protein PE_PGRS33-like isoform X1 n=1 Tax=Aphis gossypii TaxID=80765 RepID=UPI002158A6F5|nr:PE-PGRS family protein PE_PGRS33-like isoform X1 [Aphis gossypii]
MSLTNNFKTMLTLAVVVGVAYAAPSADKSEQSNEIIQSGSFITKNGDSVSASWGGFHAAASLADDGSAVASAGGNGLSASSGYGPGSAGAGAGVGYIGASEFASTGVPMKPAVGGYGNSGKPDSHYSGVVAGAGGNGGGFFDRIFAIPINVLQSVNTYLNQKQMHQGQPGAVHGQNNNGVAASASASAVSGSAGYGSSDNKAPTSVGADYGHESAAAASSVNGKAGSPMMVHTKTNYNDIFNIPITALRSVQNLLNG